MDKFIENRRNEWKKSFSRKITNNKDINKALESIIAEYIYYSGSLREFKTRTKRILRAIEHQTKLIPSTRKDINRERLGEVNKAIQKSRKSI